MMNDFDREYLSRLPQAMHSAGYAIQTYFREKAKGPMDFIWLQTTLQNPAFQHLCFRFRNRVYSVLIGLMKQDRSIIMAKDDVKNQLEECEKNNLVACTILLNARSLMPVFADGAFPLISTGRLEGKPQNVDPFKMDLDSPIEMSAWEIFSMGVQVVRDDIEQEGGKILSFSDVIGISPNVWFEKDGKRSTVFVSCKWKNDRKDVKAVKLDSRAKAKLRNFDCYTAEIELANADDLEKPLYRGRPMECMFEGLKRFDVDSAEEGRTFVIRDDC